MREKLSRIFDYLEPPLLADEDARRQRLLTIIAGAIGLLATLMLIWTVLTWVIWPVGIYTDWVAMVFACALIALGAMLILLLNRSRFGLLARLLFLGLVYSLVFFDTADEISQGRGLLIFTLPIILSSILLRPWASFVLAGISALIVEIAAHQVSPVPQPIPAIAVFFILATWIWMATASQERHVRHLRESHAALQESEARYRSLVEISPDMVILSDLEGKILMANPASLRVMGYAEEEVIGRAVWEFIAPEDQARAIASVPQLVTTGSGDPGEYLALTRNGQSIVVELNGSLIKNQNGQPQAILSVGRDITLRKKMEQALLDEKDTAYRALVENSAQGMVLMQKGQVILSNQSMAESLGVTLDELYALSRTDLDGLIFAEDRAHFQTYRDDLLAGKPAPNQFEIRVVHKNGDLRWLEMRPTILTLGGLPTYQVTAIDITERKTAEETVRAARDQLEATLNTLPDILFELDGEYRFCGFRAKKFATFLPAHASFLGKTVAESMPPHVAQPMLTALEEARLRGEHRGASYAMEMVGQKYWFELSVSTLGDVSQPSGRFIMLVRDITARIEAQEALRASENKYRKLHESLRDGFVYVDLQGRIRDYNAVYQQMLGYTPEALTQLSYIDLTPEKWHAFEQKIVEEQILPRGYSEIYQKEYRKKDGTVFPVELRTFLIRNETGENEGMWAIVRDISERKRIEEALRKSEERYRSLAEGAHDIIVIVTPDDRIEYINKFAAELVGVTPAEAVGLSRSRFFPSATNDRQVESLQTVFKQGRPLYTENLTPIAKGEVWLSTWLVPLRDETGAVKEILVISRDITAQKRIEEALRESEERYRSLAEAAHDIIVIVTPEDRFKYVNRYAAQLLGQRPEDLIGMPRSIFFPSAEINERHTGNLDKIFQLGQPMLTESRLPLPGQEFWLSTWMVPLKDEAGQVREIMAVARDITDRKNLEQALREANETLELRVHERTAELLKSQEALRRLTQQIVLTQEDERRRLSRELHDEAGQVLIGLQLSLGEILKETPEELQDIREKTAQSLSRVGNLHQQLRGLAHNLRPPILEVAGINLTLKELCRTVSTETRLPVTYRGSDDLPFLPDEVSITLYRIVQEALTNVVKHAQAREAFVSLRVEGNKLRLSVKDNGHGFDLTATTKGIGLLGMEERLKLLGGALEIRTSRRLGTHLKANIPLPEAENLDN